MCVRDHEPCAGAAAGVCLDVVSEFELLTGICDFISTAAAEDERSDAS